MVPPLGGCDGGEVAVVISSLIPSSVLAVLESIVLDMRNNKNIKGLLMVERGKGRR